MYLARKLLMKQQQKERKKSFHFTHLRKKVTMKNCLYNAVAKKKFIGVKEGGTRTKGSNERTSERELL
jgi:hypothetical protein